MSDIIMYISSLYICNYIFSIVTENFRIEIIHLVELQHQKRYDEYYKLYAMSSHYFHYFTAIHIL